MPYFDRGREPRPPRPASGLSLSRLPPGPQAAVWVGIGLLSSPLWVLLPLIGVAVVLSSREAALDVFSRLPSELEARPNLRWWLLGTTLPYLCWAALWALEA